MDSGAMAGLVGGADVLPYGRLVRLGDDVRYRRMGYALLLSAVLPVSLGADGGLYLWEALQVASIGDGMRLLAPVLLGFLLVGLSMAGRLGRLGQSALVMLGLALGTAAFSGSRVAFHEAFAGLLEFVGRRPLLLSLGLGLLAAGSELRTGVGELRVSAATTRCARSLLVSGSVLLALVYVLPQRGRPFAWLIVEHMRQVARVGGARLVAGQALFWLLGLLPLVLCVAALGSLRRAARPGILLALLARYGLSGLAVLLCFRLLIGEINPHAMLLQIRTAVLFAVAIGVGSRAVVAIVRHLLDDPLPPLGPPSRLARDIRLRQLLRAYLARAAPPAAAEPDLFALELARACHPWLRWLMRRRLAEIATELRDPPADLLKPGVARARLLLDALEARSDPDAPRPTEPFVEPHPLGLWVAAGP